MKKILLVFPVLIAGFLLPFFLLSTPSTIATSGACSSHDGVNCAAGADYDNSVICNDGWRDSSVIYWEHSECDEYLCTGQTVLLEALIMVSDWSLGVSDLCEEAGLTGITTLDTCLDMRTEELEWQYQEILEEVNKYRYTCYYDSEETDTSCGENQYLSSDGLCYCKSGFIWSSTNYECVEEDYYYCEWQYGDNSYYSDGYCYCESGYAWNDGQTTCIEYDCGSYLMEYVNGSCTCKSGYFESNSECLSPNNYCKALYGDNVYGGYGDSTDEYSCKCNAYYSWNDEGTACVADSSGELTSDYFSDINESVQYFDAITYVKQEGIVEGYSDGTYKPDDYINRAEFTKILIGAKFPDEVSDYEGYACLTDVVADGWYAKYVCFAQYYEIIGGYPDGTFKPSEYINVAEALKVTLETYFDDILDVDGEWYQKYWDYADSNNYLVEDWDDPSNNLTRGEMAELIYKIEN